MNAQSATVTNQFATATTARTEEIINKIQELGTRATVGPNYYPATGELTLRFGDYAHGSHYLTITPQEMAAARAFIAQQPDQSQYGKVITLFKEGDQALIRAGDYVREQQVKSGVKPAPRPV